MNGRCENVSQEANKVYAFRCEFLAKNWGQHWIGGWKSVRKKKKKCFKNFESQIEKKLLHLSKDDKKWVSKEAGSNKNYSNSKASTIPKFATRRFIEWCAMVLNSGKSLACFDSGYCGNAESHSWYVARLGGLILQIDMIIVFKERECIVSGFLMRASASRRGI